MRFLISNTCESAKQRRSLLVAPKLPQLDCRNASMTALYAAARDMLLSVLPQLQPRLGVQLSGWP
jgi:hypothetical protein